MNVLKFDRSRVPAVSSRSPLSLPADTSPRVVDLVRAGEARRIFNAMSDLFSDDSCHLDGPIARTGANVSSREIEP